MALYRCRATPTSRVRANPRAPECRLVELSSSCPGRAPVLLSHLVVQLLFVLIHDGDQKCEEHGGG